MELLKVGKERFKKALNELRESEENNYSLQQDCMDIGIFLAGGIKFIQNPCNILEKILSKKNIINKQELQYTVIKHKTTCNVEYTICGYKILAKQEAPGYAVSANSESGNIPKFRVVAIRRHNRCTEENCLFRKEFRNE